MLFRRLRKNIIFTIAFLYGIASCETMGVILVAGGHADDLY